MTTPHPTPQNGPAVIPLAGKPDGTLPAAVPDMVSLSPAAAVMVLHENGLSVCMQLVDVDGRVLWEASSAAGRSRLHAHPPQEVMVRAAAIHLYLSNGPQGDPREHFTGHLVCGCAVRYGYRPGVFAHCPSHGNQMVVTLDYPAAAYGVETAGDRG